VAVPEKNERGKRKRRLIDKAFLTKRNGRTKKEERLGKKKKVGLVYSFLL